MAADRLISPEPYTIFNRRPSFAPLKSWQIFVDLPAPKKAQVLVHCLRRAARKRSPPSLQVECTCKLAGAVVLKRMPTYVETVVPLKAKLRGLEIDMHGCAACCVAAKLLQISRCRRCSGSLTLFCSQVTGRSTAGHIARIAQEQPKQLGADNKVMTVTEEWLQVPPFRLPPAPLRFFSSKNVVLTRARSVGCKRDVYCPSDGGQSASAGSSPANLKLIHDFLCLLPRCAVELANARCYRLALYFDDACARARRNVVVQKGSRSGLIFRSRGARLLTGPTQ
jgi:hypothetical protein